MSTFGEHSKESEMRKIRVGKIIQPENNTKSPLSGADWLTGKKLTLKDINSYPRANKKE